MVHIYEVVEAHLFELHMLVQAAKKYFYSNNVSIENSQSRNKHMPNTVKKGNR